MGKMLATLLVPQKLILHRLSGTHLKVSTCAERPTQVSYPLAGDPSSNQLHTLVMLDIDSEEGPYLHWMVDNIPGSKVEKGHTVAQYVTPHPPLVSENPHRYMVVVMEQKGGQTAVGADDAYDGAGMLAFPLTKMDFPA